MKAQLSEIYNLWHVPFWQTKWFFVISVAIVVSILLIIAFIVYRRISRSKAVKPAKHALAQLQQLQAIASVKQGKQFFYALSNIMKEYLYNELYRNKDIQLFGTIQGLTDDQILSLLPYIQQLNAEQKDNLKNIFSGIDLIKFANQHALEKQIETALVSAKQFIAQTDKPITEAQKGH